MHKSRGEWRLLSPLRTEKIGIALWMLTDDMYFDTPKGIIIVPKGFVFDHASVPRLFTALVPPVKSAIAEASVLHDWLYMQGVLDHISRAFADDGLRELTRLRGGSKLLCFNAYIAVHVAGAGLYNKSNFENKLKDVYPEYKGLDYAGLMFKINRWVTAELITGEINGLD